MVPKSMRRGVLPCAAAALLGLTACQLGGSPTPSAGAPPADPTYHTQAIPPAGAKGTAVRRRFCATWQCASAGDKAWCMDRCVNVWEFEDSSAPPVTRPPVRLVHFDSDHSSAPGVIGHVPLRLGKHVFRATHTGSGNFILYATAPNEGPDVIVNEIGAGKWTFTLLVQRAARYELDIKAADGEWTIDID